MFWSKETMQLRLMLIIGVLFIASGVSSCQEIRYTVFGKTAEATVVKAQQIASRRNPGVMLTYAFADADGTKRTEEDSVSSDFEPGRDDDGVALVRVQYIPGTPGASRIPGGGRWVLIAIFLVMLGALSVVTVRFWIGFQEHQRRMARSG